MSAAVGTRAPAALPLSTPNAVVRTALLRPERCECARVTCRSPHNICEDTAHSVARRKSHVALARPEPSARTLHHPAAAEARPTLLPRPVIGRVARAPGRTGVAA